MKTLTAFFLALSITACTAEIELPTPGADVELHQQAVINRSNPYASTVDLGVFIGKVGTSGTWVAYQRGSDLHCSWYQLSTRTDGALTDTVIVNAYVNAFHVVMAIVAGASYTATLNDCSNYPGSSWAFTQYATSAFRLSLTTGDGDDWVQCHGNGLTSCYGHDGNDLIFTSNVKAELLGENGDDGLISSVTASTLSLRGASGSDCIEAPSPTPGVYDCGTGADDFSTGALGTGCDMVVASCD